MEKSHFLSTENCWTINIIIKNYKLNDFYLYFSIFLSLRLFFSMLLKSINHTWVVPYFLVSIIGIIIGNTLLTSNRLFLFLILFILAVFIWIPFFEYLTVILVSLYFSALSFPNFGIITLFYAFLFIYLLVSLFRINPQQKFKIPNYQLFLVLFLFVIVLTILIRGIGLSFLGSEKIGGFLYLQIIGTALLIFTHKKINLTEKQWRFALIGMCVLGIVPFLATIAVSLDLLSRGNFIFSFISLKNSNMYSLSDFFQTRIQDAKVASFMILLGFLIKTKMVKKVDIRFFVGFLIAFFIGGLSGYRSAIIILTGFSLIFLYLNDMLKNKMVIYFTISVFLFAMILLFLKYMPVPIQRSLAWVPFIDIHENARHFATQTSEWRIILWKLALKELPDYLVVGKGLAFDPNVRLPFSAKEIYAWAIRTMNYHNGPLSLLIVLGVGGFISFFMFLFLIVKKHFKLIRLPWKSSDLKHYHLVIYSFFLMEIVFFLLIFGDTHLSIAHFFFLVFLLEGLVSSDKKLSIGSKIIRGPDYLA